MMQLACGRQFLFPFPSDMIVSGSGYLAGKGYVICNDPVVVVTAVVANVVVVDAKLTVGKSVIVSPEQRVWWQIGASLLLIA